MADRWSTREPFDGASERGVLAYLVMTFPKVSETFITNEIRELEKHGIRPRVFSVYPPVDSFMHPADIPLANATTYLEPRRIPWRRRVSDHLYYLRKSPVRYLRMWLAFLLSGSTYYLRIAWLAISWVRMLDEAGISHLHCHFALNNSIAAWMLRALTGVPYSVTTHAVDIFRNHKFKRRLYDADFVVTVCDYNTRYMSVVFPRIRRTVKAICGVNPDDFVRETPFRRSQPFRIVSVGRLAEQKGYPYLVEAIRVLRSRGVPVECRIIGEGNFRPALEAQIVAHNLADHVHLLGAKPMPVVREELEAASVFVLACVIPANNNADSQPVVIKEAMAMEVPVIATNIVGCPEMVDREVGRLVPERDPIALADAIGELYAMSDDGIRNMGQAARRRVIERFALADHVRALAGEFTRLGFPGCEATTIPRHVENRV